MTDFRKSKALMRSFAYSGKRYNIDTGRGPNPENKNGGVVMAEYASNAKGNAALTTGIIGTSLGAIGSGVLGNGGALGGFFGGYGNGDNATVNRYEMNLVRENDQLRTQVSLRDANIYTDQKLLELYAYVNGKLEGVNAQLCQQNVVNAQITANISCMQQMINTLSALTKTVIPVSSICPEVMPRYNSWTAPAADAAAGA